MLCAEQFCFRAECFTTIYHVSGTSEKCTETKNTSFFSPMHKILNWYSTSVNFGKVCAPKRRPISRQHQRRWVHQTNYKLPIPSDHGGIGTGNDFFYPTKNPEHLRFVCYKGTETRHRKGHPDYFKPAAINGGVSIHNIPIPSNFVNTTRYYWYWYRVFHPTRNELLIRFVCYKGTGPRRRKGHRSYV